MRKRRQSTAEEYDLDRGTVQTRKRIKKESTISRGVRENWITPEMELAASEIESIWHADMFRSMIKTSSMERVDCSTTMGLPDRLKTAYQGRYLPWCRLLNKEMEAPAFSIIIDVVVWDCGLRELDSKHSSRRGFSKQLVKAGLKLYADLARLPRDLHKEQSMYTKEPIRNSI